MLKLKNVSKIYSEKSDSSVQALNDISLNFRRCEFVSILGPSGCGKTTLLNIIGGLDRYSSGDLVINGKSTKEYKDRDWDTYRNHSIGFVFQSYNLIPHLSVLENVELSMTIGGVSQSERKRRAKEALISVGLKDKLYKKPNQLSGGQMQRVSIARAIVNEPSIILADEPTGALDSETSVVVMKLLKEISKTRLVIMVTHNPDLAEKYSDRIIKMLDGNILADSLPYDGEKEVHEETKIAFRKKQSSMSFLTALKLSGKNLLSKKRKTIITSLAASIGIIGIAVILSVSSGMQSYIDKTMLDSTSFNYVSISAESSTFSMSNIHQMQDTDLPEYPEDTTGVYPYVVEGKEIKKQDLNQTFIDYLEDKTTDLTVDIAYSYNVSMNILAKESSSYKNISSSNWGECIGNTEYLADKYTVLAKDSTSNAIPNLATEVALVVDSYNRLSTTILDTLGIAYTEDLSKIKYSDLIGKEFRIVYNDAWYTYDDETGIYREANTTNYQAAYDSDKGITVTIGSVLRENEGVASSWLSEGIVYSSALTKLVLSNNKDSAVAIAQAANTIVDVTTGKTFEVESNERGFASGMSTLLGITANTYESMLEKLGYTQTPDSILIYPNDIDAREKIIDYLDAWNETASEDNQIEYLDMSSMMTSMLGTVVDIITYVLIAFSAISLIISSIMIAIIIYASVIERVKEIGVLRSIGARKKDVSRVFEAEAVILGLASGIIAIIFALIIDVIINIVLNNLVGVSTIANLPVLTAIGLIALSTVLLLIASLIPARIAAKKEPAVALRTE